jgi:hypothetical protein
LQFSHHPLPWLVISSTFLTALLFPVTWYAIDRCVMFTRCSPSVTDDLRPQIVLFTEVWFSPSIT